MSQITIRDMRDIPALMTERIRSLRGRIDALNQAGLRRTTMYAHMADSLKTTEGMPEEIRRARAFADHIDRCGHPLYEEDMLAGSILGMWPLDEERRGYASCRAEAIEALSAHFARKDAGLGAEAGAAGASFEDIVYGSEYRFALMARDHYDASIGFADLQRLIREMNEHFGRMRHLEPNEIAKELEHHFAYDYAEEKRTLAQLPWNAGNHINLDFARLLDRGLGGLRKDIRQAGDGDLYEAMAICLEATARYIAAYAREARAAAAANPARRGEWEEMARSLAKISERAPDTLYEALQLVWLTHLASNLNGGSAMSFARLDQYLYHYYRSDMQAGRIDEARARELIAALWLKMNEPKMRTVQSVCLGGVKADGTCAANELTALCLEVTAMLRLPYPNVSVRFDPDKSPEWLYDAAVRTVKAGGGMPMFLNDGVWVRNLTSLGYDQRQARDYYNMGCVEIMLQGKQSSWGSPADVIFPRILCEAMLEAHEKGVEFRRFEDFMEYFLDRVRDTVFAMRGAGEALLRERSRSVDPFCCLFVDGPLHSGKDFFRGGTVFGPHLALSGHGLGTAADSLSALRRVVFEDGEYTFSQVCAAMADDFQGHMTMRAHLRAAPAYGNDDDFADELAARVFSAYTRAVRALNRPGAREKYVSNVFSYNMHVAYGELTGATPNGRTKGAPVSDCVGPSQGRDENGPTALLNSVLKLDKTDITGAFALNLKISPSLVRDAQGTFALKSLIRAYFLDGGPQIQINCVRPEELRDARMHPEEHRDLVVRIAGYCEYFINLDDKLQQEIIERTMHETV